jgi:hypothetical protein
VALYEYLKSVEGKAALLFYFVESLISTESLHHYDFVKEGKMGIVLVIHSESHPGYVDRLFSCFEALGGQLRYSNFMWSFDRSDAPCAGIVALLPQVTGVGVKLAEYPQFCFRVETFQEGIKSFKAVAPSEFPQERVGEYVCMIRRVEGED